MTQPPLTIALSSVLTAAVDGAGRPQLLATLHPEFGRAVARQAAADEPGMAQVLPIPRVIPLPRRGSTPRPDQQEQPDPGPEPSTAA